MSDIKFSELTPASTPDGTEEIPGLQAAGNVKFTADQLLARTGNMLLQAGGAITLNATDNIVLQSAANLIGNIQGTISMTTQQDTSFQSTNQLNLSAGSSMSVNSTGFMNLASLATMDLNAVTSLNLASPNFKLNGNSANAPDTDFFKGNGTWGPVKLPAAEPAPLEDGHIWIDGTDLKVRIAGTTYTITKTP